MSPCCGATDTPVLEFWWRLLWVSKPEWAALFELCRGILVTCSLRFISGVTPADLLVASMVAEPSLPCTCEALVGLKIGSYHATAHSMRSGRHSTDWAIPVWGSNPEIGDALCALWTFKQQLTLKCEHVVKFLLQTSLYWFFRDTWCCRGNPFASHHYYPSSHPAWVRLYVAHRMSFSFHSQYLELLY